MSSAKHDLGKMIAHEEQLFLEYYDKLIHELTEEDKALDVNDVGIFFERSLRYNVPLGRKRRALFAIFISRYYKNNPTQRDIELARVAAWSIELLQGCFLVADDIMDNSITRRGQDCWSRVTRFPSHAINDFIHLDLCAFDILDKHFKEEDYYVDLVTMMREIINITVAGQHFDLTFAAPKEVDFTHFNRKVYNRTSKYKTSYYTFYLPAAVGMILAGVSDKSVFDEALVFLLKWGEYFQIQDDFIDCFGDPEVIGKIGSDIQENKCSWMIITALDHCDQVQRQTLKENYGSWDDARVKKVKDVYRDLDLEGKFRQYEESKYHELCDFIKVMDPQKFPVTIFQFFLDGLFQRKH